MSALTNPTLDQALALARKLSPHDRANLIARLAQELVTSPPPAPVVDDAWARWAALRTEIGHIHPEARLAERLESDRREREAAIRSSDGSSDVHP